MTLKLESETLLWGAALLALGKLVFCLGYVKIILERALSTLLLHKRALPALGPGHTPIMCQYVFYKCYFI